MKILQVALGNQFDIRDALQKHGDVIYWDWSGRNRSFNQDIVALQEEHKPDLIWMQIQTPNILKPFVAKQLAEKCIVINWTGDVRDPLPHWFLEVGQYIHLTLFTNMNDVYKCRKFGLKADYLQVGFPTGIFKPKGEVRQEADIIFMGNNVGGFPLSKFRIDMVNALHARYGNRFKCYGVGWPYGYGHEPNQEEEAKIYRGCKIAINLSHFNYERYSSDRIFRLMGAGAFCLSHNYDGIEKEFENKKHLVTWDTIEGLCFQIDHYLENEEERKKIAKSGCDHVHKQYNWTNRINELFTKLQ